MSGLSEKSMSIATTHFESSDYLINEYVLYFRLATQIGLFYALEFKIFIYKQTIPPLWLHPPGHPHYTSRSHISTASWNIPYISWTLLIV